MASYLRDPSDAVCWNCDRQAHEAFVVSLPVPPGGQVNLPLCRDCHASSYLPLAAALPEVLTGDDREPSVLLVDDDPGILSFLRLALEGDGYIVETAAHGLEALLRACRRMPDAIVLDLRMPVMDGHKFIAAWRHVSAVSPAPIMAISAHESRTTAKELGVQAFLPKPFDLDAFLDTVGSFTRRGDRAAQA